MNTMWVLLWISTAGFYHDVKLGEEQYHYDVRYTSESVVYLKNNLKQVGGYQFRIMHGIFWDERWGYAFNNMWYIPPYKGEKE